MEKVTMIKKDAVINLQIGVGFLQQLHNVVAHLTLDISESSLDQYKQEAEELKDINDFSQPWMKCVYTVSSLIYALEQSAVQQNLTYEDEVNPQDDLPALQS